MTDHPSSHLREHLLRRPEVAKHLATTERHIDRLVQSGALRCVKVGRLVRFDRRDVDAFVEASKTSEVQ